MREVSATGAAGMRGAPSPGYSPALDGVRALAVLAVMAFHGGLPSVRGGFLGVDTFFVLSGFLITMLLLRDWQRLGTLPLRAFWARRARRLLPGLLLVVASVVCYAEFFAPAGTYPSLRADALATIFYVANWHFIAAGSNYFVETGAVSPLTHTWSLAVEEQFYIVWPLLVLGLLRLSRRLSSLLAFALLGTVASAVEMSILYRDGDALTRLYYGTDTHAQSLLVGVALAVILAKCARERQPGPGRGWGWAPTTRKSRFVIALLGAAGVLLEAALWWRVSYDNPFLWQGGFLLADVGTAAVLVSVVGLPRGVLARGLAAAPLRYMGRISYGMYLWHFPLFLLFDEARVGTSGYALFAVRLAITVVVATASFFLVEQPIRRGTLVRRWRAWVGTPAAVGAVVALIVLSTPAAGIAAPGVPSSSRAESSPAAARARVVLVVGDSTALTLGIDLSIDAGTHDATVVDKGVLGCGIAEVGEVASQGGAPPSRTAPACNPSSPLRDRWPALWRKWVAQFRPSVVVILAGRWEVYDVLWRGRWTSITHPAFARYVRTQLERAVAIASSHGAHVALLTAPCYSAGTDRVTGAGSSDSPRRLSEYNRIVREVAASDAPATTLVNLNGLVCPHGRYRQTIGGVPVRAPDGVHFPFFSVSHPSTADPDTITEVRQFARWLSTRLWPTLLRGGER